MEINLKSAQTVEDKERIFGKTEEYAIISLAFDQPEFFSSVLSYLKDDYFDQYEARFIFNQIQYYYERNGVIISREMCRDIALDELTADDPHEEIINLINRRSDPREVPIITDKMMEWSKRKAMLQLYDKDVVSAVEQGVFDDVEKILEDARRITDINKSAYFFFNEVDKFFIKELEEKFTTGFKTLDMAINEGGPGRGETFCWMAPTGVGKSITLVNQAVACLRMGLNVLFVSLEMPWLKVALRFMGCMTDIWIKKRYAQEEMVRKRLASAKSTYKSELIISEFPPDEISVDHISAQVDRLRKMYGIRIDVVVIDYLELMMSRNPAYNKDDYIRQKRVGTEIDRLAKKDNVLVATATQTNRSGTDAKQKEQSLDLNQVAESYGKTMPISYMVTINQTKKEYDEGRQDRNDPTSAITAALCRFYIAKNRNGPKYSTINARINYETMRMMEYESLTSLGKDDTDDNEGS